MKPLTYPSFMIIVALKYISIISRSLLLLQYVSTESF